MVSPLKCLQLSGQLAILKRERCYEIIGTMEAQNKDYNMNVVRSVWRFVKLGPKKHRVRLEDALAFKQRRTQKL